MSTSTSLLRRSGVSLLLMASATGCAQSGTGDMGSPTSPSALIGGASETSAQSGVVTTLGRPVTSFNADGNWDVVVTDRQTGEVLVDDEVWFLDQDSNGDITSCGECEGELFTFRRLAVTPARIIYRFSAGAAADADDGITCNRWQSGSSLVGPAELDLSTETITGTATGKLPSEDGTTCVPVHVAFVLTRSVS